MLTAQEEVPALGHDFGDWTVTTPATCVEGGEETRSCSRCDATETRPIDALGHQEVTDPAVPATCTEPGLTEGKHCSRCNAVLTAQEVVPATGHTPVTDAAVAPTCTETGLTEGSHCSVCNAVLTAQEVIPALGHDWDTENIVWNWAADYSTATATFTCKTDPAHHTDLNATVAHTETATSDIYTATVELEGTQYSDRKTVLKENVKADILSASLSLKGDIAFNIYVKTEEEGLKAVITYNGPTTRTMEFVLSKDQSFYQANKDRYEVKFPNIPAKEMTRTITLKISDADGNEIPLIMSSSVGQLDGNAYKVRVADWCYTAMEKYEETNKYHKLAKAILNYGTETQRLKNYCLDDLADPNGLLDAEMAAVVADESYDIVFPENVEATGYLTMALNNLGAIEIWLNFNHEVVATVAGYEGKYHIQEVTAGEKYRLVIEDVKAKQLGKMFEVTVTENGVDYLFKVSALSYANLALTGDKADELTKNYARALYLYYEAAVEALN